MEFIETVEACGRVLERNADLQSYAAKAALDELARNWRAAIRDGAQPATLLPDLDLVAATLLECKAALA